MRLVPHALAAILVLDAVRELAYGIGMLAGGPQALVEFGHDLSDPAPAAAITVARLLGAGLLGLVALYGLAAWWTWRGRRAGAQLALALGAMHLLFAAVFALEGFAWDMWFSGILGTVVIGLSTWTIHARARAGPSSPGAGP